MNVIVRRLLSLLFKLKVYKKHYKLPYSGRIVSYNEIYSGGHWSKRSGIKNDFHKIFSTLLLQYKVKAMSEVFLTIFYCSRHDCDNIVLSGKLLLDTMRAGGYIQNDDSRFYKGIMVIHDPSLPKNTLEFHLIGK